MPKTTKKQWTVFLLIVGAFLLLLSGLYLRLTSVRSNAAKVAPAEVPRPVKVISPVASDGLLYRELIGRVEGGKTVNVHASVGGWVSKIYSKRGGEIKKGEIILELSDERKTAEFQELKFRLKASKAILEETKRQYAQNQTLFKKGIISKDRLKFSKSQLEIEIANTRVVEASYKRAKFDFDSLKLRSPIEGSVVRVVPDVGQEVFKNALVAKIVDLNDRRLIAGIEAEVAKFINPGTVVDLKADSSGFIEHGKGEVVGISRTSDGNGPYEIEIKIISDAVNWWPGEIIAIKVPEKSISNMVSVPRTAVLSSADEFFIFVVQKSKSLRVPVEVTWVDDKTGFIPFEMLPPDCLIIVEGSAGLINGQKVRVITE